MSKKTPFPQANNLSRVMTIYQILANNKNHSVTKQQLIKKMEFKYTSRQLDYYIGALKWLGLVSTEAKTVQLSSFGKSFVNKNYSELIKAIKKIMYKNSIFRKTMSGEKITVEERKENGLLSEATFKRRILTVRSWLKCLNII